MLTVLKQIFVWWNQQTLGTRIYTFLNGKLVGKDEFGNKYFENKKKNKRWVIYSVNVDASNIPVEWFSLIHFTKNKLEQEHELKKYSWQKPHKPNLTGTEKAYYPNKEKDVTKKKYKTWKS